MMNGASRPLCAAVLAALLASCVSDPPKALAEGAEELLVVAGTWIANPGPSSRGPDGNKSLIAVESVQCTLQNDKGAWAATTPRVVRVPRSVKPLVVDCAMEGYRPVHYERECLSPRQIRHVHPAGAIPLGIVITPLNPMGLAVVAGAAHDLSLGKDADLCTYGIDRILTITVEPW